MFAGPDNNMWASEYLWQTADVADVYFVHLDDLDLDHLKLWKLPFSVNLAVGLTSKFSQT